MCARALVTIEQPRSNPVAVGWLILLLSWPNHLYPVEAASIAGAHWTVVALTTICGIALCSTRLIRWQIPAAILIGTLVSSLALGPWLPGSLTDQFFSGHLMLMAFFLATDATCSPANRRAMWIYGLGMGFLVILIRAFGIWPDATPFALMLMNVMSPLLDRIRPPTRLVRR